MMTNVIFFKINKIQQRGKIIAKMLDIVQVRYY